ncbi:Elongation factor [Quillaja saponaria]|uniref:Elongation factor n=1 Tax=Quillaja saponaria TaxID=32244 RepID=A0AAD7QFP3_QUISA|nr:Elongation factor [Quillaja saponaria]
MAPAQPLSEMDKESKPTLSPVVAPNKENADAKGLNCMSDCEKAIVKAEPFLDEQSKAPKVPEHMEVDITSCTNKGEKPSPKAEDPDATEYSSSFADTTSDTDTCSRFSEAEVESGFLGDSGSACTFDAYGSAFQMRRKKLTNHWRSFIRPLMWRCKWTELRIKEIESQESKYAKEIAEYDRRKHLGFDQLTVEEYGSKSLPFSGYQYSSKAIKRRKRKKVEDTTEVASYMSHHKLFAYLENKKTDPDGSSLADDSGNPVPDLHADSSDRFGITDEHLFFGSREDDNSLEQLLWTIDTVHSRVQKLKSQIDVVMSKNAAKFSSSENLSLLAPCDVQTSSAHSPTFSAGNGDTVSVGAIYNPTQHASEYDIGDLVMPGSDVSSYGDAIPVPDIIESTVGLLSAADVILHQPQTGDLCEDIVDNAFIHNEVAEAEGHNFRSVVHLPLDKHQKPEKGEQEGSTDPSLIPTSESDVIAKSVVPQDQSTLKSCLSTDVHFPKNKRKRGERKAASGGWSKKCSGEPDSQ